MLIVLIKSNLILQTELTVLRGQPIVLTANRWRFITFKLTFAMRHLRKAQKGVQGQYHLKKVS